MTKLKRAKEGILVSEIAAYLADVTRAGLSYRFILWPMPDQGKMHAYVQVFGIAADGTHVELGREGEIVSMTSPEGYMGAWFRAALREGARWEGVAPEDARALVEWEKSAQEMKRAAVRA